MLLFTVSFTFLSLYPLGATANRYRRQANGCGPASLNIDVILRKIGEDVLIACCNEHDLCYDTCGHTQTMCDTAFLNCMMEACEHLSLPSDIHRCQNDARLLFWFVFLGGQLAYEEAQQKHRCTEENPIMDNFASQKTHPMAN